MKTTTKRHKTTSALPRLTEIEIPTAEAWLASGAITETIRGEENTYYIDGFYREFFCKNYPEQEQRLVLVTNGTQLWTDFCGLEQEVICPTEEWAEDLAKLTIDRINARTHTKRAALHAAGFKPCAK
jgi:hypothetical protein